MSAGGFGRFAAAAKGAAGLFGVDLDTVRSELKERMRSQGEAATPETKPCSKLEAAGLVCGHPDGEGHEGRCEPIVTCEVDP